MIWTTIFLLNRWNMTTTKKTCFKCHRTLSIEEFYRHSKMADGHLNKCKDCTKADTYESRHVKHRDRVLQYDRERARTPERISAAAEIYERWKKQNQERRAAQIALGNAVRAKKVIPLPCAICGNKAEAHHPDYSSPLDVIWLCPAHHKQAHALAKSLEKAT